MTKTIIGAPCKKCQSTLRYASTGRCVECHRASRKTAPTYAVHHFPKIDTPPVRDPTRGAAFPASRAQLMAGR